jgi:DNA-binding SARP family transcriptional activator/TolB-like protein/tetratricopeptide (TPR) repeat protein
MLALRILGGLSLERDGRAVPVPRKSLALLGIVAAAANGGVSRDKLVAYFWPESDEERARNALRQRLFAVKRDAGSDDVFLGTNEVRLNPAAITSDLVELERALAAGEVERVAELYQGPLLDGVHFRQAPELERWIDERRSRLATRVSQALRDGASAAAARGDAARSVILWRRLAAIDPTSAEGALGLAQALADAGDPAGALQHIRAYETLLREEYGVAVAPAVLALDETIRARGAAAAPRDAGTRVAQARESTQAGAGTDVVAAPRAWWREPRRRAAAALSAAALLAGALLVGSAMDARPERVVVAPFANGRSDSAVAGLGEMTAEWITQGLVAQSYSEVVDSRMVLAAAREADTTRAAPLAYARDLGATTLVSGSYVRRGDSLFIQAQLIDVETGSMLQTIAPIGATLAGATDAIERVRQKVLGALFALRDPTFDVAAIRLMSPPTFAAYREYVAGMEWLARNEMGRAGRHFLEAARRDSTFAEAALWAAEQSQGRLRDSLIRAVGARRDELTPYDRAKLDYLIAFDAGDLEATLIAARRLAGLAPSSGEAQYKRAYAALITNRYRETLEATARIDPTRGWMREWWFFYRWPLQAHHLLGEYRAELRVARQARQRFPRNFDLCLAEARPLAALGRLRELDTLVAGCHWLPEGEQSDHQARLLDAAASELRGHGHADAAERLFARMVADARARADSGRLAPSALASVYSQAGRWPEALAAILPSVDTSPAARPRSAGVAAIAAARTGDTATARVLRLWLERRDHPDSMPAAALWLARIAGSEGRVADALRFLAISKARGTPLPTLIHADRAFEPIENRPAFRVVLRGK